MTSPATRGIARIALLVLGLTAPSGRLAAQVIGEPWTERHRLAEITGSARGDTAAPSSDALAIYPPELRLIYNSAIPHSLNDGALWAGRGLNASLTVGAGVRRHVGKGRISLQVAPTIAWSQNRPFQIYPSGSPERSPYASPFYDSPASADIPLRFGSLPISSIHPGESHLLFSSGRLVFGVSSESQWWGPAIRNTLLISTNAPSIPHAVVRTARPLVTRIGSFEGRLIAGTLVESLFFDTVAANDTRSVSGFLGVYRPSWEPTLTLGLSRVVYRVVDGAIPPIGDMLSVLTRWESPRGDAEGDPRDRISAEADQIISLFGRWIFPQQGFEVYGEWARTEIPRSLTEYLAAPHHTQGYTVGLQLARPTRGGNDQLRLQTELTYLEQNVVFADRPPRDFYTGRATLHGFTNRGQVVGAAIGPGGSSQWVALDRISATRSLGVFAGRIRWNTGAFYRRVDPRPARRDVTVLAGLRASRDVWSSHVEAEFTAARRLNYLFQNEGYLGDSVDPVDVDNLTLALRLRPR
jgi:hypothetical protein